MKKPREPHKPSKKIYNFKYQDISDIISAPSTVNLFIAELQQKLVDLGHKSEEVKLVFECSGSSDGEFVQARLRWEVEENNPYYTSQMKLFKEQLKIYNKKLSQYKLEMEKYLPLKEAWDKEQFERDLKAKRDLLKKLKKELGDA